MNISSTFSLFSVCSDLQILVLDFTAILSHLIRKQTARDAALSQVPSRALFSEIISCHNSVISVYNKVRAGKNGSNHKQSDLQEGFIMATNNKHVVPEARAALDRFKMEAASEVGINLNNSYNGDITARQAGSIGGQMVKNMTPVRSMRFERHNRISIGHKITVKYVFSLTV